MKTYTTEQIKEAFDALRRDIDSDYAGTELGSERGRFLINDIETDVLHYLKGTACWMAHQDETAQRVYHETAGIAEAADDDQRDEDNLFYSREVETAVARQRR